MKTALFPGSFDPFTIGHADIVARGLKIFDRVIIAIGENCNKSPFQNLADRPRTVKTLYSSDPRVEVVTYHGLTISLVCVAETV